VGPSSQRKREGERGLGEELGRRELGRARGRRGKEEKVVCRLSCWAGSDWLAIFFS
jgi:hypothetical protein